ncbi:SRPBCC family protein [Haloferula sargassicola]
MAKFHVSRSISIAAPPEKILPAIHDFRKWPAWSPWLIAEPDAKLDFSDDGKFYRWEGQITGCGEVTVTRETPAEVEMDLVFLKPFRAKNLTSFRIEPDEDGSRVTWSMVGSLPFFLFFMAKSMATFVGADFERGLKMLKDLIELGAVPSKLEFHGTAGFPTTRYVGVRHECEIAAVGDTAAAAMKVLRAWLAESELQPSGCPMMLCDTWDMSRGRCEILMALPLPVPPANLPDGWESGEIDAGETYRIRHTGPYRHLGNAWSSGMMRSRAGHFRLKRGVPLFEIYENDPEQVGEAEVATVVHFPIR